MKTAAEALERGADRIERYGWWKIGARDGHYCALTSMMGGKHGSHVRQEATVALCEYLGIDHNRTTSAQYKVACWNDAQDEGTVVVRAMRATAARLTPQAGDVEADEPVRELVLA